MTLDTVRDELRRARAHIDAEDAAKAVAAIDRALAVLTPELLLTPIEAANMLGIRSDFPVQLWCRNGTLTCVANNGCLMVPVAEVERVADSPQVREMRALDRLHDLTAELGSDHLEDEWLADLAASRPGKLPWQT